MDETNTLIKRVVKPAAFFRSFEQIMKKISPSEQLVSRLIVLR